MEIYQKMSLILFIGLIGWILFIIYNSNSNNKCQLENFDIDNLKIIKRTPEYSKLINNLIDEKSFIFTDSQIKSLKNPQQIFKLSNNNQTITNISDMVYNDCNVGLEFFTNTYNYSNNPVDATDNQYEQIKTKLYNDINVIPEPNCDNINVLQKDTLGRDYLKNYYLDIYGNRIEADLTDYFTAYYTLINSDDNVGLPVNTLLGKSNFIIPDQYNYQNKLTNAYNIDWSRIINPIGYT